MNFEVLENEQNITSLNAFSAFVLAKKQRQKNKKKTTAKCDPCRQNTVPQELKFFFFSFYFLFSSLFSLKLLLSIYLMDHLFYRVENIKVFFKRDQYSGGSFIPEP